MPPNLPQFLCLDDAQDLLAALPLPPPGVTLAQALVQAANRREDGMPMPQAQVKPDTAPPPLPAGKPGWIDGSNLKL